MQEIGDSYGYNITDYRCKHIGNIARREKKIKQIVQRNKKEITKDRIPHPYQYKANLYLIMQPYVADYLFQKEVQLF